MSVLEAIFLGILQGLTEFIPVSSSGHLVLAQRVLGLEEGVFTFDVMVHLATALSVILVLRKDIGRIILDLAAAYKDILPMRRTRAGNPGVKLTMLIIAGSIPTFLMAILFKDFFEGLYVTGKSIGIEFIATGVLLWYAETVRNSGKGLGKMSYTDSVFIGFMQGTAILPAISRSGATIAGALIRGLKRDFAAKFSFLISLPAILGAAVFELIKLVDGGPGLSSVLQPEVVLGFLAALISGYLAVRFMLKVISTGSLKGFAYYVFLVGSIVLVDQIFFNRFFMPLW